MEKLNKEAVLKAIEKADGHTILAPDVYLNAGLPSDFVRSVTRTLKSGTGKAALYDPDGYPIASVDGVYGLDLLYTLADRLAVVYGFRHGRGSQAEAIQKAIKKHYENQDV